MQIPCGNDNKKSKGNNENMFLSFASE